MNVLLYLFWGCIGLIAYVVGKTAWNTLRNKFRADLEKRSASSHERREKARNWSISNNEARELAAKTAPGKLAELKRMTGQ